MTDVLEIFMRNNNLRDSEDIDALLTLTDIARELISKKQYSEIKKLINYTVENSFYEAFHWLMQIIQEDLEQGEHSVLEDFVCDIGCSIHTYDIFIEKLHVDFNAVNADIEMMSDKNGEIQSFFNILTYRTRYQNIYFVSAENFDTKDNDYIQYKLLFTRK